MAGLSISRGIAATTVAEAAAGDADALARIVEAHHHDMARIAYVICGDRDSAQDAVQAAWPIAWRKLGSLREPDALRPWLMSVAANQARQAVRRQQRHQVVEIEVADVGSSADDPGPGADPCPRPGRPHRMAPPRWCEEPVRSPRSADHRCVRKELLRAAGVVHLEQREGRRRRPPRRRERSPHHDHRSVASRPSSFVPAATRTTAASMSWPSLREDRSGWSGISPRRHLRQPGGSGRSARSRRTAGWPSTRRSAPIPGGGPSLVWSADGSGLVVTDGSGRLGIRPIDGGPTVSGLPPLAPTIESSVYAADGTAIDHTDAVVSATDGVGHLTTWYAGELGSGTVADARYAADGHAVWMLLDQRTDGARVATLARADTPHEWHVVGTVDVGSGAGLTWISGIAPDDSAVALSFDATNGDPNAPLSDYLIRATDGKATPHDGNVIGFVPSDVVDSWP